MSTAQPTTPELQLWQPVLLRAGIAAAFGAVTIFWQEPGAAVLAVSGALYLLATGGTVQWAGSRLRAAQRPFRLLQVEAAILALTGIVVLFLAPAAAAVAAAAGLVAAGAAEFAAGRRHRALSIGRDWQITGVVSAGAGVVLALLPLFTPPEPHAILGVLGGSAIITAVVLALAGLSLRSPGAAPAVPGRRVN